MVGAFLLPQRNFSTTVAPRSLRRANRKRSPYGILDIPEAYAPRHPPGRGVTGHFKRVSTFQNPKRACRNRTEGYRDE